MVEVIPSINASTFDEVKERIAKVEPYVRWCHLDVTDGVFSKHETWRNPADLSQLYGFLSELAGSDPAKPAKRGLTPLNVEAHLMIQEPERVIDQWLVKPVKRIVVHVEASTDIEAVIKKCHSVGVEIGLAVNPETPWEKLQPWFDQVDLVQVLAVNPGPSGQKMGSGSIEKVASIHDACPSCTIEIDGGVNDETSKKVIQAGATVLVVGSYLFNTPDMGAAVEALKKL